ncbi:hypothetical protein BH23CHL2_BH23CHL2_01050 [soil metagenome]
MTLRPLTVKCSTIRIRLRGATTTPTAPLTRTGCAALALTEAVTRLSDREDPAPDKVRNQAARHYDKPSMVIAIANINVWNRLNVATRQVAGAWIDQGSRLAERYPCCPLNYPIGCGGQSCRCRRALLLPTLEHVRQRRLTGIAAGYPLAGEQ